MRTIDFNGKTYVVEPGIGAPADAVDPINLSGPEQVTLYNLLGSNLGIERRVSKFSDKETGAKRIVERLEKWASGDDEKVAEEVTQVQPEPATSQPKPAKAKAKKVKEPKPAKAKAKKATTAPKGKPAPKAKKGEPRKRGMRFVFPFNGPKHMRSLRNSETLRAQCVELLKKGATFKQVEELVERFDADRSVKSHDVERRAYELVRIMHYYLGYGIEHNQETGIIKLHQRQVG